jgi:hypothetical protein
MASSNNNTNLEQDIHQAMNTAARQRATRDASRALGSQSQTRFNVPAIPITSQSRTSQSRTSQVRLPSHAPPINGRRTTGPRRSSRHIDITGDIQPMLPAFPSGRQLSLATHPSTQIHTGRFPVFLPRRRSRRSITPMHSRRGLIAGLPAEQQPSVATGRLSTTGGIARSALEAQPTFDRITHRQREPRTIQAPPPTSPFVNPNGGLNLRTDESIAASALLGISQGQGVQRESAAGGELRDDGNRRFTLDNLADEGSREVMPTGRQSRRRRRGRRPNASDLTAKKSGKGKRKTKKVKKVNKQTKRRNNKKNKRTLKK